LKIPHKDKEMLLLNQHYY